MEAVWVDSIAALVVLSWGLCVMISSGYMPFLKECEKEGAKLMQLKVLAALALVDHFDKIVANIETCVVT